MQNKFLILNTPKRKGITILKTLFLNILLCFIAFRKKSKLPKSIGRVFQMNYVKK